MPTDLRSRIFDKTLPELSLPPAFRLLPLREAGHAFDHAQKIASKEGAGTLVWVGRFDVAEFAIVLEPDEPLASARRVFYACMNALVDTLAVHAPPETMIYLEWPDAIFVNGGLVGGGQLAWPRKAQEKERPDWLVFGAMLRTAFVGADAMNMNWQVNALEEAGFGELGAGKLVETFSRNLMVAIDAWQEVGFEKITEPYLLRLRAEENVERMIDGAGDLLTREKGKTEVSKKKLLPALAKPTWLDPGSGEMLA